MKKLLGFVAIAVTSASLMSLSLVANAGGCRGGGGTPPPEDSECPYTVNFAGSGSSYSSKQYTTSNNSSETMRVTGYTNPGSGYQATNFRAYGGGIGITNSNDTNTKTKTYSKSGGSWDYQGTSYANSNVTEEYTGRTYDYYEKNDTDYKDKNYNYRDYHTMDNVNSIDAVLLSFDYPVSLLDITLSLYGDSDITIMESKTGDINGSWDLVGHYDGTGYSTSGAQYTHNFDADGDEVGVGSSSYYLLSALNSGSGDSSADLFKLLSLTYCEHPGDIPPPPTNEVPSPAGLLLLLAGLPFLRRMRSKQS